MVININILARKLSKASEGVSIAKAHKQISTLVSIINKELAQGNTVKISKFVTLEIRDKKAYVGTHPKTQKRIKYKASKQIHAKLSKALKQVAKELSE